MTRFDSDFSNWSARFRTRYGSKGPLLYHFTTYFPGAKSSPVAIEAIRGDLITGVETDPPNRIPTRRNTSFTKLREQFSAFFDVRGEFLHEKNYKIPHSHPVTGQSEWWPELGKVLFAEFVKDFVLSEQKEPALHVDTEEGQSVNPDEVPSKDPAEEGIVGTEGNLITVTVNRYERDSKLRAACLAKHGYSCQVCGMNFAKRYGAIGENFIHVHHLRPLGSVKEEHEVDPINDLAPVCPNCHAMLHKGPAESYTIEELRAMLQ